MDIQYIPKSFWHSLSVAVLTATFGLTYIAYKSNSISIEIENAKILLKKEVSSSSIEIKKSLEKVKKAKAEVEKKYEKLVYEHNSLKKNFSTIPLTTYFNKNSINPPYINDLKLNKPVEFNSTLIKKPKISFENVDMNINNIENSIVNLEKISNQIDNVYAR